MRKYWCCEKDCVESYDEMLAADLLETWQHLVTLLERSLSRKRTTNFTVPSSHLSNHAVSGR